MVVKKSCEKERNEKGRERKVSGDGENKDQSQKIEEREERQ
jgi:hypothetical protein